MRAVDSIAIYRSGAMGDLIATFPVLQALRQAWPNAKITLVAPQEVGELAVVSGWADRVLSSDSAWVSGWYRGDHAAIADALGAVDLFVAFVRDEDGELARTAQRAGIAEVITWPPLPPPNAPVHVADHALSALEAWGIARKGIAPVIRPTETMLRAGRLVMREAGVDPARPYVVIHTGSSSRKRNWPDMPRCAALIGQRTGFQVLLHRGPVEAERGMGGEWPKDAIFVGPFPVMTLAGLIAGARGYIGNDTGPSHLAAALGVPTVAVFGASNATGSNTVQWGPRGTRAASVSPDGAATWPTPDAVLDTLTRLMASRGEACLAPTGTLPSAR